MINSRSASTMASTGSCVTNKPTPAKSVSRARSARASATRLLLLDEPLAALDAGTRAALRSELRARLTDFAGVGLLVTHEPVEAMVLADRLLIIEAGRVVQQGLPAEVARHPRSDYVARLVGLNVVRGTAARTATGPGCRLLRRFRCWPTSPPPPSPSCGWPPECRSGHR